MCIYVIIYTYVCMYVYIYIYIYVFNGLITYVCVYSLISLSLSLSLFFFGSRGYGNFYTQYHRTQDSSLDFGQNNTKIVSKTSRDHLLI